MNVSTQAQAILLMTAWFTKPARGEPKPLTPTEWGRFAAWLKDQNKSPEALLASGDPLDYLNGWLDSSVTPTRIRGLLERSAALGLALEKWQRAGLWVMTRSDSDYPARLKRRLKLDAPPVLFGCGERQLLDRGGIAVVGSRAADDEDLAYTSLLGAEIAAQGFSVVSGGARGVDEAAMLGALEKEGTVTGVLADSLLRAATSAKYRKGLMGKNLVLVSSFNPEVGFDVGNAMARNKYIYCLSDAGIVVATSKEKGGTWNGAAEDLKYGWVPLWVKKHADPDSGNAALIKRGARWLPSENLVVGSLASQGQVNSIADSPGLRLGANGGKPELPVVAVDRLSFYELFIRRLEALTSKSPVTLDDLLQQIDVGKTQLNDWIKRAEAEGRVSKLDKPVRYASPRVGQQRLDL
jgi:predicted Rossmann fold nucleotide-binding protein DprA/Smf involved in DNA uptake